MLSIQDEQKTNIPREETQQICTFRIGGYLYGINIRNVKEINQELHITPVPHAPSYVRGLVNIRGEVYLIFDLRNCFGFQTKPIDENNRIILFKTEEAEFSGVLVDALEDVIRIPSNQIESYNLENSVKRLELFHGSETTAMGLKLVQGVYQLPKEILIILNVNTLINSEKT